MPHNATCGDKAVPGPAIWRAIHGICKAMLTNQNSPGACTALVGMSMICSRDVPRNLGSLLYRYHREINIYCHPSNKGGERKTKTRVTNLNSDTASSLHSISSKRSASKISDCKPGKELSISGSLFSIAFCTQPARYRYAR